MQRKSAILWGVVIIAGLFLFFSSRKQKFTPAEITNRNSHIHKSSASIKKQTSSQASRSTASAITPPSPPKVSQKDILEMVKRDRLCISAEHNKELTSAYTFKNDEQRKYLLLKSLAAANRTTADPCVMALLVRERKRILWWSKKNNSTICRVVRALALTDQLNTMTPTNTATASEMIDGLQILNSLQSKDRSNSYYSFVSVYPLATLGKTEDLNTEMNLFFNSSNFVDPLNSLSVSARELGKVNGTSFVIATEIYSALDGADYSKAAKIVREWVEQNPSDLSVVWAETWTAKIDQFMAHKISEPLIQPFELAAFRGIARSIAQTQAPQILDHSIFNSDGWSDTFNKVAHGFTGFDWSGQETCHGLHQTSSGNFQPFIKNLRDMVVRYTNLSSSPSKDD